jgi:hypothetical protein
MQISKGKKIDRKRETEREKGKESVYNRKW